MRHGWVLGVLVAVLIGAVVLVPAASAAEESTDHVKSSITPRMVDASEYPMVHLYADVHGLSSSDAPPEVVVEENGAVRATVAAEWIPTSHDVVLIIDTSGSMRGDAIAAARQAATALVDRIGPATRVGLVEFAGVARTVVGLTMDHNEVRAGIAQLTAGGETALYDGVELALDLLDEASADDSDGAGTATLVVLADGEDNASTLDEDAIIVRLRSAPVTVQAIELRTIVSDVAALKRLAAVTGGVTVTAEGPGDLGQIFAELDVAAPSRLRITYESAARGQVLLAVAVTSAGGTARYEPWRVGLPMDVPATPPSTLVEPSGISTLLPERPSAWLLVAGWALAVASLIAVVAIAPHTPRLDPSRLGGRHRSRVARAVDRVLGAAESGLQRGGRLAGLADALDRAGVAMTPGRYLVNIAAQVAIAGMAGFILSGTLLAMFAMATMIVLARVMLTIKMERRRAAFADQLDDTLQLLAGSLRAGHSLLQSIDTVASEAEKPTSDEFRRIINATRLGQDLSQTFEGVVQRTESADLDWVAQAIAIHREVGGNLAGVLDSVGETIRERNQIRRQVKALSAEGRLSAMVLMGLPIGLLAFLSITSPGHIQAFTSSLLGLAMLGSGIVLLLVGGLWLRKLVRIEF
ncbi:MAG: type II secretion system F family protein [Nitriliruptoraceae bacterium]